MVHKKGIDLKKYQNCILQEIAQLPFHEILNFAKFLEGLGFEQVDEYLLASYVWTNCDYETDEYMQYMQYINSHYDEKLVKISDTYRATARQFLFEQEFNDIDFNTEAETFDFTTGNFMFFKVVSIISGNFVRYEYTFDDFSKLFAMIKYYYPRVMFNCDDNVIDFTIKLIKSSRNI